MTEATLPEAQPPPIKREPILPPLLTGTSAYLWLWVLPVAILLVLNLQAYWLIEGNMEDSHHKHAWTLGIANLANLVAGMVLYVTMHALPDARRQSSYWGIAAVAIQIGYLWIAAGMGHEILPNTVTTWIYTDGRYFFNQFSFCMLPLFWGLLRIACANTGGITRTLWFNWCLVIFGPLTLYIGFKLLSWLDSGIWIFDSIAPFLWGTIIIGFGLLLFFAIMRATMLTLRKLSGLGKTGECVAILLVALVMPVGGLLLNRTIPFPVDFQAWEIYALVLINTGILAFATFAHIQKPQLSFWLLCASFPFTLYFFVVFLPYTPLSIFAILAMGAGFLVLTPTFLFTLHLHLLLKVRGQAQSSNNAKGLLLGGLLSFLLLPAFFTARGLADKSALNQALDYTYTPNLSSASIEYPGSRSNLRRALASHRNYKNGIYYPLLSDYYSWLVFDNLVLPDDKIDTLEKNFFNREGSSANLDPFQHGLDFFGARSVRDRDSMPRVRPPSREVEIRHQDLRLIPSSEDCTQATLTLQLENVSKDTWGGAEYINQLAVPPGILVNGFRLHINGTPVPGRIFEKKTALWVYTMIRDSERRDPGLLVYNHPREIELRVFPIMKDQPATVEIDFLIPASVEALTAPNPLPDPSSLLPQFTTPLAQVARGEDFTYIAPLRKDSPSTQRRDNYLHLLIDRSEAHAFEGDLQTALQQIAAQFPAAHSVQASYVNYGVVPINDTPVSLENFTSSGPMPKAGGNCHLDLALAHAIRAFTLSHLNNAGDELRPEPLFVLLRGTDAAIDPELELTRIWQDNLSALDVYTSHNGNTVRALLTSESSAVPLVRIGAHQRFAHAGRSLIFPRSNAAPEIFDDTSQSWCPLEHQQHSIGSPWAKAIALWVNNHRYAANPGAAALGLKELVNLSRTSGVLIPATSYIVVENEAQWKMLELKEDQKLDQNEALDFLETPTPPTIWIGLGFGAWLFWRQRRKIRICA